MRELYYDQKRDKWKWREKQSESEPPVRSSRIVGRWQGVLKSARAVARRFRLTK